MPDSALAADLLNFLQRSPTPFHATKRMAQLLSVQGFQELREVDKWRLEAGKSYYVTRNDSSIIAFKMGHTDPLETGVRFIGAHTDSPCLKVKPNAELSRHGCLQLGVEVYGGALLHPWFDRDLSLAGRVTLRDSNGQLRSLLVDFKQPIATIPSLAIHLNRTANSEASVNPQTELPLVIGLQETGSAFDLNSLLQSLLEDEGNWRDGDAILDRELFTYDVTPPAVVGLKREFLASARLDNLLSCFVGLSALRAADDQHMQVLVCSDHEEIGSESACGAKGDFLQAVLARVFPDAQARLRAVAKSLFISADNAHAVHPNYADKHDGNHVPRLNAGPVIKINANQRYATNGETSAWFKTFCESEQVPFQNFVVRSDMGCGSTIGPITASELGVQTIDIGCPQWGMHSIRETAGVLDFQYMIRALTCFYQWPTHFAISNQNI